MSLGKNTILQSIEGFYTQLNFGNSGMLLASSLTIALGIFIVSYASNVITKRYLIHLCNRWFEKRDTRWARGIMQHRIIFRLSHMIPALIIYLLAPWMIVDDRQLTMTLEYIIQKAVEIYMIATMAMILSSMANVIYETISVEKKGLIKSYFEIAKILMYIIAIILIGSIILNKSPVALLAGLGALTAVLSLVFRDFLLGLVASIQIGSHDIIRAGDHIEVPDYGADGIVIDISLHTVKVQNGDKTIVTIPTYAFTNTKIKNWRGIMDAGGRQIKRAINIDMHSIHFCDQQFKEKLKQCNPIKDYFAQDDFNIKNDTTNLGVFRAYLETYLRKHPDLHQNMTSLVRQLAPSAEGLPIEIYVFSHRLDMHEYEAIQADLFDHILAILPYFELRVFQNASDFAQR